MKRTFILLFAAALLGGCVGMSTTDGDSTKNWIIVESSKSGLSGGQKDVCYRLDLRFTPGAVMNRFDTDQACITRCCWFSERKTVEIDLNAYFVEDLIENGYAYKYNPDKITFHMRYSSFLNTIHGSAEPSSILRSDGLVTLDYVEVSDSDKLVQIEFETMKPQVFDNDKVISSKTSYTYAKLNQEAKAREEAASRIAAQKQAVADAKIEAMKKGASAQDVRLMTDEEILAKNANTKVSTNRLSDSEREDLLKKRLAFERTQAVNLVKRFYNKEIDSYIMHLDKQEKAKGFVLLTNDRSWTTVKTGSPIYRVSCKVNGQLGTSPDNMENFPIECGIYEVNLDDQTVHPRNAVARNIIHAEYK